MIVIPVSKFLFFGLFLLLIVPMTSVTFAEKIISIEKTVDVDKISLIDSLSYLDRYSQILPDYIQSFKLLENDVGNMKIGLDWITIDTDVKFTEFDDGVLLEVISGDFKGTTLYVMMIEKLSTGDILNQTDLLATLSLQRSWHMGLLTSFVSDTDIESMLHKSLNGLVDFTKNPPSYGNMVEEKEQFCIFGLCF